jgi:hypothetical protein
LNGLPSSRLVAPRAVSFLAADGTRVHGQLALNYRLGIGY